MIANKPAGIPVQADKTGDKDLWTALCAYSKKDLKLINRVDRPVSGCVILGKTDKATRNLSQSGAIEKTYLALVEPHVKSWDKTLTAYLSKGRFHKAQVSDSAKDGYLESNMECELVYEFDKYQLLKIKLNTGRFHQIRAMLSHIGAPVKGDVKYGARRSNKDRTIGLHAWKMKLRHPISGQSEEYTANLPENDILWKLSNNIL